MSYIAFELDALNIVPSVAAAARVPADNIAHGLLKLWAWCFRAEIDVVTTTHLDGFFAESATLTRALFAFGFIEPAGDDWRVKGAERYLKVKRAQREGGKRGGLANTSRSPQGLPEVDLEVDPEVETAKKPTREPHLRKGPPQGPPQGLPKVDLGKTEALTPSTEHLSSSPSEKNGTPRAPAHHDLVPVPVIWPTPEHERAAERYLVALESATKKPPAYRPSALAGLALRYADDFVAAVADAEQRDVGWQGWHVSQPRNWLETLCRQAGADRAKAAVPAPPPRKGYVGEAY